MVPVAGRLPRADLDVELHHVPGAPAQHPHPDGGRAPRRSPRSTARCARSPARSPACSTTTSSPTVRCTCRSRCGRGSAAARCSPRRDPPVTRPRWSPPTSTAPCCAATARSRDAAARGAGGRRGAGLLVAFVTGRPPRWLDEVADSDRPHRRRGRRERRGALRPGTPRRSCSRTRSSRLILERGRPATCAPRFPDVAFARRVRRRIRRRAGYVHDWEINPPADRGGGPIAAPVRRRAVRGDQPAGGQAAGQGPRRRRRTSSWPRPSALRRRAGRRSPTRPRSACWRSPRPGCTKAHRAGRAGRPQRDRRRPRSSRSATCPTTCRCCAGPGGPTRWPTRTRAAQAAADEVVGEQRRGRRRHPARIRCCPALSDGRSEVLAGAGAGAVLVVTLAEAGAAPRHDRLPARPDDHVSAVALTRRQRASAHLLQLRPGGHLLGEQRGLDAVEQPFQPADQLGLGDPQLRPQLGTSSNRRAGVSRSSSSRSSGRQAVLELRIEDSWISRSRWRPASSSGAARTSSSSCLIIVPIRITFAGCSTIAVTWSSSPAGPRAAGDGSGRCRRRHRGWPSATASGAALGGGGASCVGLSHPSILTRAASQPYQVGRGSPAQQHLADVLAGLDQPVRLGRVRPAAAPGRSPAAPRRTRSAARRACSVSATMAAFCSSGRARAGRRRARVARLASSVPRSSSPLRPPCRPSTTSRPPIASDAHVARQVLRAHVVEDDVDARAAGLARCTRSSKSLVAVVDRHVGAELAAGARPCAAVPAVANTRASARAGRAGSPSCRCRCAAVHQQPLAGLQPRRRAPNTIDHTVQVDLRQRGGVDERDSPAGHGHQLAGRHARPARRSRRRPAARTPRRRPASRRRPRRAPTIVPRALHAEIWRRARRRRVVALPLQQIGPVDRGRRPPRASTSPAPGRDRGPPHLRAPPGRPAR